MSHVDQQFEQMQMYSICGPYNQLIITWRDFYILKNKSYHTGTKRLAKPQQPNLYLEPKWLRYHHVSWRLIISFIVNCFVILKMSSRAPSKLPPIISTLYLRFAKEMNSSHNWNEFRICMINCKPKQLLSHSVVDLRATAGNCSWVRTPQLTFALMSVYHFLKAT